MVKQIKSLESELIKYKKENNELNNEINRLNELIKNLRIELENIKKQKPLSKADYHKLICKAMKYFIDKWLAKYKIKLLVRLYLKMNYEKLMDKYKRVEVKTKTKPVTPTPETRIKIVKRNTIQEIGNLELPGKVSYKRRNEKNK